MRRHEKLDTIGLGTVFLLATVETMVPFGFRHDPGLMCLGIPLMILSALLLLAVHWPKGRVDRARHADERRPTQPLIGTGLNRVL